MQNKDWITVICALLCCMLFGNRKVRLSLLIKEQLKVFRNYRMKRISLWDCVCFFLFPIVISLIFVFKLGLTVSINLAELLATVFSIVFTVLFGFTALFGFTTIMISKIDSQNRIKEQVAKETFVSIVFSTVLSSIAVVLSIILTQVRNALCLQIISVAVVTISLLIIMLLILIIKRIFNLYTYKK